MSFTTTLFSTSLQQEFVYRTNFIMWRIRNIIQILLTYFLWMNIFDGTESLFGYTKEKILSYVFGILVLRAIVFSVRSTEVAGEISRGELSNYMIRPLNYFKYWFIRDLSSKFLNFLFMFAEVTILYLLLKPSTYFQSEIVYISLFIIMLVFAIILYFLLLMIFSMIPFWFPTEAWGAVFLLNIFTEILGGAVFPLDIFPSFIQKIILLTPFPYLLFIPLQTYLGKYNLLQSTQLAGVSLLWILLLSLILKVLWRKGIIAFRAEGR